MVKREIWKESDNFSNCFKHESHDLQNFSNYKSINVAEVQKSN